MTDTDTNSKPKLVPQPHGGALMSGGTPGHKGGGGRPASVLRDKLRGTIEQRVEILEKILDDPDTSTADRLRCIDLILKYSIGSKIEVGGDEDAPPARVNVEEIRAQIFAHLPRPNAILSDITGSPSED